MAFHDEYPEIFKEFVVEKNFNINPYTVKSGSNKKAYWKCPSGHEYLARIGHRTLAGSKCPYCSGLKLSFEKSLEACNPELAKEWDYEKNYPLKPSDVFASSVKKAHWICAANPAHKWPSTVDNRRKGNGCPYCVGKKVLSVESFAAKHPELLKEWAYDLNRILPDQIPSQSNEIVFWKCRIKDYHVWEAMVAHRVNGRNCPYCSGHRLHINDSALKKLPSELLDEWDFELNQKTDLSKVSLSTLEAFYWKCSRDGSHKPWENRIRVRLAGGGRCPACYPFQKQPLEESLAFHFPEIAKEWHSSNLMSPDEVRPGSALVVQWQCPFKKSHVYPAGVVQRVQGHGCPKCSNAATIPELRILAEVKSIFMNAEHHYSFAKRKIDVYIPEIKTGIEWDSEYHHSKKDAFERDVKKSTLLLASGVQVIRFRHKNLPNLNIEGIKVIPVEGDDVTFADMLLLVRKLLNQVTENGDHQKALNDYLQQKGFVNQELFVVLREEKASPPQGRALLDLFPDIVNIWHPTKNHIGPKDVYPHSHEEVWLQCRICMNEWHERVAQRTSANRRTGKMDILRCAFCDKKKPHNNYNFAICYPHLLKELLPEDNPGFDPFKALPRSGAIGKWTCSACSHKWSTSIHLRTGSRSTGCPKCNGKILSKERSLAFICPEATEAWDIEKNDCLPTVVFAGTHNKYYFRCLCRQSFLARPNKFISGQRKCKECRGMDRK